MLLIIAIVGLPLFAVAAFAFASKPVWAVKVVLGLYLFEAITVTTEGVNIGLQIYPADLVFGVLFGAALVRIGLGMSRKLNWSLIIILSLFFLSLGRGIASYGAKTAGVDSRDIFYLVVALLYFSTCFPSRKFLSKTCALWLGACVIMLALAVFRWIAVSLDLGIVAQWEEISTSPMRVLNARGAFFLASGLLISFYMNARGKGRVWHRKLLYFIGPALLLLQHRTVWVLLIVSFIWMSWRDRRFRKWLPIGITGMAVVALIMAAVFFNGQGAIRDYLTDSATNDNTFIWRLAGWIQLVVEFFASGVEVLLLGKPFGAGYVRVLGGTVVDASPHDFYVQILIRTGFIGLFALLWIYRTAKKSARQFNAFPSWRFWSVIVISQIVYNLTYAITYEQGMLLGLIMALGLERPIQSRAKRQQSSDHLPPEIEMGGSAVQI